MIPLSAGAAEITAAVSRTLGAALAAPSPTPPSTELASGTGHGPEWGAAAPVGLLIILLMGGALFLLIKSMNRNLRRVPASFDPAAVPDDGEAGRADDRDPGRVTSRAGDPDRPEEGPGAGPADDDVPEPAPGNAPEDEPADPAPPVAGGPDAGRPEESGSIQRGRSQPS